jgi:response regulator RpfG family c-di-GMP phosphodiesterase
MLQSWVWRCPKKTAEGRANYVKEAPVNLIYMCGYAKMVDKVVSDYVKLVDKTSDEAKHLTSLHPETRILYMSGYTDNVIVHHGVLEKGMNYIQKPFTIDELTRKVREVLDK